MMRLFDDPKLLLISIGLGMSLLCLFFAFADTPKDKQAKRLERLRQRGKDAVLEALQLRRDAGDKTRFDQMVRRMMPRPELLRERLYRTGYDISLGGYGVACLVIGIVALLALIVFHLSLLMALPVAVLIGLWIPHFVVGYLAKRRANKFTNAFPEAIGLMVRGLKSGLPVTETFNIVAQEIPDPVGMEFRQVSDQIRLGHPVEQSLWDAAKRIGTPELKFLVVALSIQRETGGNLAETLENLDNILRRRRQMRLKIRAMSSEARASAMIIGSLPFAVIGILSIMSPDYLTPLFVTVTGHKILGLAVGSMTTGIGIMAKLIRFDI
jgi:tight adherence protein B